MKKVFAMMTLLMLSASAAMAAPRTKAQMFDAARQAINGQRATSHRAPSNVPLKVLRSMEQIEVIGTEESGFAVVTADDLLPAVLGV
ncbi:MAG: Spi family protease inhibitor, partial [Prevotella sp.]|nr:Spi family protease inhibitor [Prevotella sp.]